ncbi:DNA polymerase III subunit delta', partial [Clostridiaceae bacterium HSG29]|nr:DNA polymerase III subunit delta' [Clostridiaceae bacterium HSG29]
MSFKNIYGHSKNKNYFKKIFESNKLSHSYIFDGVEGIGKKLFAMNLIKTIMCKNEKFISCEICSSCKKINHMNHPDVMIIEPDGNSIKNKQVKEFQIFLNYKPNESKSKVVIINDSNKMTLSSQNTILKILEEPPEYAIIIFISSNSNNLLETIKSRSQIIKFNKLSNDEIQSFLTNELKISNQKAVSIALFSDGIINKAYQAYEKDDFLEIREKTIEYSNQLIFNDKINAIKGIQYLNNEKDNILLIF